MKAVIGQVRTYIVMCILGTVLGAVFYMFYKTALSFVVGMPFSVFSFPVFMNGLIKIFPIILLFTSLFLCLYRIRHPSAFLFQFIMYLVLNVVTWSVLLPSGIRFIKKYAPLYAGAVEKTDPLLTSGFFRKNGDIIYYFSSVSEKKSVSGAGLRTENVTDTSGSFLFSFLPQRIVQGPVFTDPLVRDNLQLSPLVEDVFKKISLLQQAAFFSSGAGWYKWICFASLGIVLFSVYGFVNCFSWRLLNGFTAIFMTLCLCLINSFYYFGTDFFYRGELLINKWTSQFTSYHVPIIVIINILCTLIFCAVGIISIFRSDREGGVS